MEYDLAFLKNYVSQCYKLIDYKKNIIKIENSKNFNKDDSDKYCYYNLQKDKLNEGIKIVKYVLDNNLFPENKDKLNEILDILEGRVIPVYFNL